MDTVTEITQCRVCCSPDIELALDFGTSPLANRYVTKEQLSETYLEVVLQVVLCHGCGCVQLRHTVSPELLFNDYLYASSTSGSLNEHFKAYSAHTVAKLKLDPEKDFIVGIGGNDGVLEKHYDDLGFHALNVEPATKMASASYGKGIDTLALWFNRKTVDHIIASRGQASLITCNNCFAHMPDINGVVEGVKALLVPGGHFVFENAYLLDTVNKNLFDQFYHEHVFYWGLWPLQQLFVRHGMTLVDVEFNAMQEGSFRAYVRDGRVEPSHAVSEAIARERQEALYTTVTYEMMWHRMQWWKNFYRGLMTGLEKMNHSICCYGVPAKFTMLSKLLDLTPERILYAVENSPIKVGLYTPGSHIPIVGPDHFHKHPSDACLITARNYAEHIKRTNPQYSGKWIDL